MLIVPALREAETGGFCIKVLLEQLSKTLNQNLKNGKNDWEYSSMVKKSCVKTPVLKKPRLNQMFSKTHAIRTFEY